VTRKQSKQAKPRKSQRRSGRKRQKGMCLADRPVLEANAAGIDIGAREIFVAVPAGRDAQPVRACATFTEDLQQLADWLVTCGITTVAMESTGVYWIPLYDTLESRGIKVCLVNARHMKNVPGRRTDWHECQWLQYLHSVGLLRGGFRPEVDVTGVRTVMRHRHELVQMSSQHVLHIHKALTQMNLQIHHVIDDITGLTGLAIVDAILAGQRDPVELAKLRNWRIKADEETIRKSLVGNWREEHLFTLRQSRELYRTYQQQIVKCDQEIERLIGGFEPRVDPRRKSRCRRTGNAIAARKREPRRTVVWKRNSTCGQKRTRSSASMSRRFQDWKPWRYRCSGKWAGICRSGRRRTTLLPGRDCARTTTSAAGCCGRGPEEFTTGLGKCSGKPLIRYITVSPRWETISAG